jgi:hypothetical protein
MNTSGPLPLGYASQAIMIALLEELIASKLLSANAASNVSDKAVVSLQSAGNLDWIRGSIAVVGDIRRELAKQGVK